MGARTQLPQVRAGTGTIAAAVSAVVFLWLFALTVAFDAPASDVLLWSLVEFGYVILPGWLLFACLAARPGGALRQLTMGWVVGLSLSILFFMLTAATGTRGLMSWYPLLLGLPLAVLLARRWRHRVTERVTERPSLAAVMMIGAAVLLAALVYGLNFFGDTPLPGLGKTVTNSQDLTWAISLAADALHHWPMTDSSVSGEPLPYHNFSILHVASLSQVSGIELPLAFFRLWCLPLVVLIALQFVEAGRTLFRSLAAGLIALLLFFFVSEAHLFIDPGNFSLFGWLSPILIFTSPSYLFGLPFLLALVTLTGEELTAARRKLPAAGDLSIFALVAIGAAGAKVSIIPLLLPALGFYLLFRLAFQRRVDWAAVVLAGILVAVQFVFYWTLYRGHSSGLYADLGAIDLMSKWQGVVDIRQELDSFLPGLLAKGIAIVLDFLLMLIAPLAGLYFVFRDRVQRRSNLVIWFAAILLIAFLSLILVSSHVSGNQLYGVNYGLVCGVILSASGLVLGWRARPEGWERCPAVRLLALAWVVVVAVLVLIQLLFNVSGPLFGIVIPLVAFVLFALASALTLRGPGSGGAALLIVTALVFTGFLGAQFNYRWNTVVDPPAPVLTDYRMTPDIYDGLRWLRDETSEEAVFAVNDQYAYSWNFWPVAYDYSAFSERRSFFGAWAYSQRVRDSGLAPPFPPESLFPERKRLNDAAFAGDPGAMEELRDRYDVQYMVVDRVNGDPANLPRILRNSKLVFARPDLVIVKIS